MTTGQTTQRPPTHEMPVPRQLPPRRPSSGPPALPLSRVEQKRHHRKVAKAIRWCSFAIHWYEQVRSFVMAHRRGYVSRSVAEDRRRYCDKCEFCYRVVDDVAVRIDGQRDYWVQRAEPRTWDRRIVYSLPRLCLRLLAYPLRRATRLQEGARYCRGANNGKGCGCGHYSLSRLEYKLRLRGFECPQGSF